VLLVIALVATLVTWKLTLGSLSVAHISRRPAEAFYWAAILCSNTLGTALGDFLADDSGLGFAGGAALLFTVHALVLLRVSRPSRSDRPAAH
jgi:uncharacterized membrane-anchored protein